MANYNFLINKSSKTYNDKTMSIWEKNVQAYFTEKLIGWEEGSLPQTDLYELFDEMLSIQQKRYKIMVGMYNRSKLIAASRFDWSNSYLKDGKDEYQNYSTDPREADGVPIFARGSVGITKENHKLHTAFDKKITTNKASYIASKPPKIDTDDNLKDLLMNKGLNNYILELAQSATRGGNGYILAISPEGENDVFYRMVDEWECFSFYDQEKNQPKYAVRFYEKMDLLNESEEVIILELYTSERKYTFEYQGSWTDKGETEHLFNGVPLVEFPNNTERLGDVELTTTLQDAYDILDSDLSSEITQLRLAYLYVKASGLDIDDEFMQALKKTGVFPLDESGEVGFIEKTLNSDAIENLKKDLERKIYEYSNSYNPNELGDEKAMTAYQIKQKLFGLEQSASETIRAFTESLRYLLNITLDYYREYTTLTLEDIGMIEFKRNIPSNMIEDLKGAREAGLVLSQEYLANSMPFEVDYTQLQEQLVEEMGDSPFQDEV